MGRRRKSSASKFEAQKKEEAVRAKYGPPMKASSVRVSKHDSACLARRSDSRLRFVCTCGLGDAEVEQAFAVGPVVGNRIVREGA